MNTVKNLLTSIESLITRFNSTSIKRLFIYCGLIYPLIVLLMYKEEVRLMLFKNRQSEYVEVRQLDNALAKCHKLQNKYDAEAVILFVYQPNAPIKQFKERIAFSNAGSTISIDHYGKLPLIKQTKIFEDFRTKGYALVTKDSNHRLSGVIQADELNFAVVTPIKDLMTDQIIGEVIYLFKEYHEINYKTLINEGQMFAYDIQQK